MTSPRQDGSTFFVQRETESSCVYVIQTGATAWTSFAAASRLDIYPKNMLVVPHVKKKKSTYRDLVLHAYPIIFSTDSYAARSRLPNPSRLLSFASRYWPRARVPEPGECPGGWEFHSQGCSVHSSRGLPGGLPLSEAAGCPPERKVNKCEVWAGPLLLAELCALYLWL